MEQRMDYENKLGVLFPVLLCLNLLIQGLNAEPQPVEYVPGSRPQSDFMPTHDTSWFDKQIADFDRMQAERDFAIKQAVDKQKKALLAEQKKQAEYQKQTELAPGQAINQCNGGNMHMCFLVGHGYKNGSSKINNIYAYFSHDDFKAVQFYTKACNGGNMKGCSALGSMYNEGKGTPLNKDKAAQLFTKACNANDAIACNNLGVMYQNGYGMWGNKSKAKELYNKACQLRSQAGCSNYANLNQ